VDDYGEGLRDATPPAHAPFRSLRLGTDGTIWLGLRSSPEGQPFLVLDDRGDAIATVLIPAGQRFAAASRTELWTTVVNDVDLVAIVRYRVEAPSRDTK
jgi:hypothetical protein